MFPKRKLPAVVEYSRSEFEFAYYREEANNEQPENVSDSLEYANALVPADSLLMIDIEDVDAFLMGEAEWSYNFWDSNYRETLFPGYPITDRSEIYLPDL